MMINRISISRIQLVFISFFGLAPVFFLAGCASSGQSGPTFDAALSSRKIEVGMTEAEVIKRVGFGLNKAEMTTCGGAYSEPFQCKILTFGWSNKNLLRVYFQTVPEGSFVNSWRVSQY